MSFSPLRPTPQMGSTGEPDSYENDLLNASFSLCRREFKEGRVFAAKALKVSPKHHGIAQLLAISDVLSVCPAVNQNEPPNWYSILNLPRFTRDPDIIRARCDKLKDLLNPEKNHYPYAAEAREWVIKAAFVLCNQKLKSEFDQTFKMKPEDAVNEGGTFWTVCPYCYFMYEYQRVYRNCVLRCQNANCKRAFTAVAVAASVVPTPEVVETGTYRCDGFLFLAPDYEKNGEDKSWKMWAPFVSKGSDSIRNNEEEVRTNQGPKTKTDKCNDIIDLSDDESARVEEGKKRDEVDRANGGKVGVKRKKVAAKGKKKVAGKGIRAKWKPSLPREGGEGVDLNVEGNREGMGLNVEGNREGAKASSDGTGIEFCAGDDDIYVSLNPVTDLDIGVFGA